MLTEKLKIDDEKTGNFEGFSQEVGIHVDIVTGEIQKLLEQNKLKGNGIIKNNINSIENNNGREIGKWGENRILQLLNGFKSTSSNFLWDIEFKNFAIECKACEGKNGIVIRERQLIDINNTEGIKKYYSLIYYKKNNLKMYVDKVYIFPVKYIIYFYNTSNNARIMTKRGYLKRLHQGKSEELFNLDLGETFKRKIIKFWGKEVKVIEYLDHNLDLNKKAVEI